MKKKIFLSLLVIFVSFISACPSAHQDRLFLLGECSLGFIFLETQMQRTTDPMGDKFEMTEKWYGESFLKIYSKNYKLLSSEQIDKLDIKSNIKYDFIKESFSKALARAKLIRGFTPVTQYYFSYCDFQQKCSEASLRFDSVSKNVQVELKSGKRYEVSIIKDTLSIAGDYVKYYSGFNSGIIDYETRLFIGSIRKFRSGNKLVTIVHLASGDPNNSEKTERKPNFDFTLSENRTFYEPLLWHGHGFDFFIVE